MQALQRVTTSCGYGSRTASPTPSCAPAAAAPDGSVRGECLAQTGATERPSGCGSDGMSGGWDLPPDRRIFCAAATAADYALLSPCPRYSYGAPRRRASEAGATKA